MSAARGALWLVVGLVPLLSVCLPACRGDGPAPPDDVGEPCTDARDCDTGLCIDAPGGPACTMECGNSGDCPPGFVCERFSLAEEGDAGPVGEAVRACAPEGDAR